MINYNWASSFSKADAWIQLKETGQPDYLRNSAFTLKRPGHLGLLLHLYMSQVVQDVYNYSFIFEEEPGYHATHDQTEVCQRIILHTNYLE